MIAFANDPDPIFRAILDAALQWTRDEFYPYVDSYQASAEEIRQLDEGYEDSQLSRFFSRSEALAQTDRLITALQDSNHYRVTDYHWLILYVALETFCDLHNDGEFGDSVGPYTIDHIDFGSMIDQFFFDTDFLFLGESCELLKKGVSTLCRG